MAREFSKSFYHSRTWQRTQALYIHQAGGLCERCLAKGMIKPGVIVHHIKPLTPENINDPAVTLNPDNLQLLCMACHADVHKGTETRYKIDELGRVIAVP